MSRKSSASSTTAAVSKGGFQFKPAAAKKSNAATAAKKVVAWEEIEAQTPPKPRRAATKSTPPQRKLTPQLPSSSEEEPTKSRKRPVAVRKQLTSSSPKKTPPTNKRQKTASHYPRIDIETAHYRHDASNSHKQKLVKIVKDVCAAELAGLNQYFGTHEDKAEVMRDLKEVLEALPSLVKEGVDESTRYKPEVHLYDQSAMRECDAMLERLTEQEHRLQQLLANIDACGQEFDIMLQPIDDTPPVSMPSAADEVAEEFRSQLTKMITAVDAIKDETASVAQVMTAAQEKQTVLYQSYDALRLQGLHRGSAQDSIRQLMNFG